MEFILLPFQESNCDMKNLPQGLLLLLPFPRILFPFPEINNTFGLMELSQADLLQIVTVIKTLKRTWYYLFVNKLCLPFLFLHPTPVVHLSSPTASEICREIL